MAGRLANERTPTRFVRYSMLSWKFAGSILGDDNLYPVTERIMLSKRRMSMNVACPRIGRRPMSKGRGRA